jgi:hypothetical protein
MIYSSSKSSFLATAKQLGIKVDRSIEITDFDDLKENDVFTQFHPIKEVEEKISKPKPKGRTQKTKTNFKDFLEN